MAILTISRQAQNLATQQVVNFAFSGTATIGVDYNLIFPAGISGSLTGTNASVIIPANVASVDLIILPIADILQEVLETIVIRFVSGTPSIAADPQAGACVFTIKNNDSSPVARVLGVTTNSTALIGSLVNVGGSPYPTNNYLNGPENYWDFWVNGALASGRSDLTLAAAPILPLVIKAVLKSPIALNNVGASSYACFQDSTPANFAVNWVSTGQSTIETWRLQYRTTASGPFSYIDNVRRNTWHDFIWEFSATGVTLRMDNDTTLASSSQPATTLSNVFQLFFYTQAMAAFGVTNSLLYDSSMFPITLQNI